jgi:hypothetical protein
MARTPLTVTKTEITALPRHHTLLAVDEVVGVPFGMTAEARRQWPRDDG